MQKSAEGVKPRVLSPEIRELSEVYYMSLDCPRSLTMYILLKYDEFDQVASSRATPSDYASPEAYHLAALASDWLRKYPGLPLTVDPEIEAKKSWYQSEEECRATNEKFSSCLPQTTQLLAEVAAEFIGRVLGPCPLDLTPRFGPGATVSDPARATTVLDKVSTRPTVTEEGKLFLSLWQETAWERSHLSHDGYKKDTYDADTVEGNTFFTVPKTATTHRGCAKGPSINVAYQLAVGNVMRDRLLRSCGLNLAKGQEYHSQLAQTGSLHGTFATLDSERASDTMSLSVVNLLLSKSGFWGDLLRSLREPKTFIDGKWVVLEKFSAMGNGYTFELETLVFLSLCYSVAWAHQLGGFPGTYAGLTAEDLVRKRLITVYGDDVIVPAFLARDTIAILHEFGFTVNLKKSYFEGEFRESCGGDYFAGVSVQTEKLDKEPSNPADWFSIHNGLRARFTRRYPFKESKRLLNVVKNQLPRQYRNMYGPYFLGDRVLHGWYGPHVKAKARSCANHEGPPSADGNQWVGVLRVLTPRLVSARLERYSSGAQLAYLLYTGGANRPMRRPTSTLRYEITDFEGDYHVIFEDYVPRAPRWLTQSPYARHFGILPDGSYVG